MRRHGLILLALVAGAVAAALAVLILSGGLRPVGLWAADWQRAFQNDMARGLRALRAGEPGATAALLGFCFAYGFFHAVGPGHGKILIGGYGVGRGVGFVRLGSLAVASSVAQGLGAIILVSAGIAVLDLTRQQLVGVAEVTLAPLSHGAIGLIGVWLVLRGLRAFLRLRRDQGHAPADETCAGCGHRHGPTATEAAAVTGWRDGAALVGAIALRPCSGALLLLVLTWQMGIYAAGLAGTLAMSLGTASVTLATAALAVALRRGGTAPLGDGRGARVVFPLLELGAGAAVILLAFGLLTAPPGRW